MNTEPTILVSEGTVSKRPWRMYFVISDERVVVIDMEPALLAGWNVKRVTVQGPADWPDQTRDSIVAYKLRHDPLCKHADLTPESRATLLAKAAEAAS